MTSSTAAKPAKATRPYSYCPGTDGCDDTWDIVSDRTGSVVASVPYWDWPDDAEAIARDLTAARDAAELLAKVAKWRPQLYLCREFAEVLEDALEIEIRVIDVG